MPLCWNGRRGGLKIRCQQWRVGSSPTSGTTKIVALKAHFLFESSRGQAQFLFMRPDENRQKRVPVKLFTISWEKEQTSDSGTFASSKLPKAPFVTPPQLPSEAEILSNRINFINRGHAIRLTAIFWFSPASPRANYNLMLVFAYQRKATL